MQHRYRSTSTRLELEATAQASKAVSASFSSPVPPVRSSEVAGDPGPATSSPGDDQQATRQQMDRPSSVDGGASSSPYSGSDDPRGKKLVLVVYGAALDGAIIEGLAELEVTRFTRWVRVHGQGRTSPPHLDSHIWPGTNHVLAILMDPAAVPPLLAWLRDLKARASMEGLRAFVLPVEDGV
ncbi:MAG: hypothetical protein J7M25_11000 [Deltaproteobacteria bacterium]|nr:hypothetical protein [Deltaproteobacteria bacterium]